MDRGQKPFLFLFLFLSPPFFCRAASRAQRTLSFRFRFPGKFSASIFPPLRFSPNRVIKIRPPFFIYCYSSPLPSFTSFRIKARFTPLSFVSPRLLEVRYFAKNGKIGVDETCPVVFAEGNEESLERSQRGGILANLLCLTSDA